MLIWHVRLIESIKVGVSWILFSVLWQKKQKTALIADCFLRRNSLRRTKSHTTQPHNLSQPWRHRPWSRADQYGIQRRFHPSPTHGMYFGSTVVRGDVIGTFYLAEIGVGWSSQVRGKKLTLPATKIDAISVAPWILWGGIGGHPNNQSSWNFAQRCSIWWRRVWEGRMSSFII